MSAQPSLTPQDILSCGWEAVVVQSDDYLDLWTAFRDAATRASSESRHTEARALQLLCEACSLGIVVDSVNEPFSPMMTTADGRRSTAADDFSPEEVASMALAAPQIPNARLRARLADLGWLLKRPRDVTFANIAIDAYRELPLSWDEWLKDSEQCWCRAISLTYAVGSGSGARLQELENSLLRALFAASSADGFFAVNLAQTMKKYGVGKADSGKVAIHLQEVAEQALQAGELTQARSHFEQGAKWFKIAGDSSRAARLVVQQAETWVRDADARSQPPTVSFMVAAGFFDKAIQTYRLIPRQHRSALQVESRISDLRERHAQASRKAIGEFGPVKISGIDIADLVAQAQHAVEGKPLIEALRSFATLYGGPEVETLRTQALENMRRFPFQNMFATQVISADGRVIAKAPAMSFSASPTAGDDSAIRHAMVRHWILHANLVVQGQLMPAHDVLLREHRLTKLNFMELAQNSPVVPQDRVEMWGRALFDGYDRDFVSCIHLLAPQFENLFRMLLKAAGAMTSTLSRDGIETENGLSTLIELPEAPQVFGENMLFEIRAVYCDPFGANLRNQVAHGLLDEVQSQSAISVYAWWMALRMVLGSYLNHAQVTSEDASPKTE